LSRQRRPSPCRERRRPAGFWNVLPRERRRPAGIGKGNVLPRERRRPAALDNGKVLPRERRRPAGFWGNTSIPVIFGIICSLLLPILCLSTPSWGYKSGPREIYHTAWMLVRDNYFDLNFAGQDWAKWEHRFDTDIHTVADAHKSTKIMLDSLRDR